MIRRRIHNPTHADIVALEAALAAGEPIIVQYSDPLYTSDTLRELERLAAIYGALLQVRFYSHGAAGFDCAALRLMPSVRRLDLDCLARIENWRELANMEQLEQLSLGVFELEDGEILTLDCLRGLRDLSLRDTRNRIFDLGVLESFTRLETLGLAGHTRGIEVLGRLKHLHDLSLYMIPRGTSLASLSQTSSLRVLHLTLGGRESIAEVEIPHLEELHVIRVRGLRDVGALGRFPSLVRVLVEDQIQLEQIELSADNAALESVRVINCKSLRALPGLELLPRLTEVRIFRTALEASTLKRSRLSSSLRTVAFSTGKARADRSIRATIGELGYMDGVKDGSDLAIDWERG